MDKALRAGQGTNALTFMVWCVESGEQGTRHIQAYLQLTKKMRHGSLYNKISKWRVAKSGLIAARGTPQQNIDYCSHTGTHAEKTGLISGPWQFGTVEAISSQGKRTDIDALCKDIKGGKTIKELCTDHTGTMLKFFGNALKMQQVLNDRTRSWMTELFIFTGVAGSGKSYDAHKEGQAFLDSLGLKETPYDLPVPAKGQPLWMQGYDGQAVMIIDDFYGTIDINMIKRLADQYPMTVPVKNGHAQFLARRIYITSNIGWKNWWAAELLANKNDIGAVQRRITEERSYTETHEEKLAGISTYLNDEPIIQHGVGEVGDLACDEDFDDIVRGNKHRLLSPIQEEDSRQLLPNQEAYEYAMRHEPWDDMM